jgi:hypothetical protein
MEIRSSLKKIDNYLKIVSDFNAAILAEGTMAPEELQMMKKYLVSCVERIENIQVKLGLPTEIEVVNETVSVGETPEQEVNVVMNETHTVAQIAEEETVEEIIKKEIDMEMQEMETSENEQFEEKISVEPETFLRADLPSIKYNADTDFQNYYREIKDENEIQMPQVVAIVEETQQDILLTAAVPSLNILVAPDEEKVEEKIDFASKNTAQEPVVLTAELHKIIDKQELNGTHLLVSADEVKEEMLINFTPKTETAEPAKMPFNLVDTSHEKTEENIGLKIPKTTPEFEQILNRKSLSESISLNDKFVFVRELFGSQFSEYENSLKEIDIFQNYQDALNFCNEILAKKYNWAERKSFADNFLDLLAKKYQS